MDSDNYNLQGGDAVMRICALMLVLAAFLAAAPAGSSRLDAGAMPQHQMQAVAKKPAIPKCVLATSFGQAASTLSAVPAKSYCAVGKKKVAVVFGSLARVYDAAGWTCSVKPPAGKAALKLTLPGVYKAVMTIRTAEKWGGKFISRSRSVTLPLNADQAMCGKPGDVDPSTGEAVKVAPGGQATNHKAVCDFFDDGKPGSCAVVTGYPGGTVFDLSKMALWTDKPTLSKDGTFTFTMGHFVSSAGYCQRQDFKNQPTDFWWHTVSFHYWQCGEYAVVTEFQAWGDYDNKTCRLPDNKGDFGYGVWQFQLAPGGPDHWGRILDLMPALTTGTGLLTGTTWKPLALERATAYLKPLPGDQPPGCFSSTPTPLGTTTSTTG